VEAPDDPDDPDFGEIWIDDPDQTSTSTTKTEFSKNYDVSKPKYTYVERFHTTGQEFNLRFKGMDTPTTTVNSHQFYSFEGVSAVVSILLNIFRSNKLENMRKLF